MPSLITIIVQSATLKAFANITVQILQHLGLTRYERNIQSIIYIMFEEPLQL